MSTTENTSAIDEKKTQDSGSSAQTYDFKGFLSNYASSIVFTIGISIFIIGGLGLYTSKVAQANILPDNIDLAPYTIFDRVVKDIPIDINVMRPSFFSENKDTISQKVVFNSQEYLDSFKNSIFLCKLKNSAQPNSSMFSNGPLYFSKVYDSIIANNFGVINTIFLYLSYLPESVIMLLYGLFGIFIWLGMYFLNNCISIFYHIVNIPELFRTESYEKKGFWEASESISFFRIMKLLFFFWFWFAISIISTFTVPIFTTLYGLISPLYATYSIPKTNEKRGVYDFIKDTFVYKKLFFFILATLSLISNGITYLGPNSLVGIAVAIIFAYFMGLYTQDLPETNTDGFTAKIRQNIKQASVEEINLNKPQLVNLCTQVPIADDKIESLIKKGVFRKLSTNNSQKGSSSENISDNTDTYIDNTDTNTSDTNTSDTNTSDTNTTKANNKKITKELTKELTNLAKNTDRGEDGDKKFTSLISELEKQNGGKRNTHYTKKYNIRLV